MKQEQKLEDLQNKIKELQEAANKLEESMKNGTGNKFISEVEVGQTYFVADHSKTEILSEVCHCSTHPEFINEQKAINFHKALRIYMDWFSSKGVAPYEAGKEQWHLDGNSYYRYAYKVSLLSPRFNTREECEASVKRVGEENIKNMRKWFLLGE